MHSQCRTLATSVIGKQADKKIIAEIIIIILIYMCVCVCVTTYTGSSPSKST